MALFFVFILRGYIYNISPQTFDIQYVAQIKCRDILKKCPRLRNQKQIFDLSVHGLKAQLFTSLGQRPRKASPNQMTLCRNNGFYRLCMAKVASKSYDFCGILFCYYFRLRRKASQTTSKFAHGYTNMLYNIP